MITVVANVTLGMRYSYCTTGYPNKVVVLRATVKVEDEERAYHELRKCANRCYGQNICIEYDTE